MIDGELPPPVFGLSDGVEGGVIVLAKFFWSSSGVVDGYFY